MSEISVLEYIQNPLRQWIVCSGSVPNASSFDEAGSVSSFDKIMPRPTMAGGTLTYGFISKTKQASSLFFISSTDGFTQLDSIKSFHKADLNQYLSSVSDLTVRAQLLKHFSAIVGEPIEALSYDQISYKVDDTEQPDRAKNVPQTHAMHLTSGTADFPSDASPAIDQLFLKFVLASELSNIESICFDKCATVGGFVRGITAADIVAAGYHNTFIPRIYETEGDEVFDEEILCSQSVLYINQPVALVAASSQHAADEAAKLVEIRFTEWKCQNKTKPLQLDEAIAATDFFPSADGMADADGKESGDVDNAFSDKNAKIVTGIVRMPGQYHHFMETHHASCIIQDDQVEINMGTQALDKVQRGVAYCLGLKHAQVVAKCRRTGGGFGGKATRSAWIACAAAIGAKLLSQPCSLILSLRDCITIMGGRSIFVLHYKAAFDVTSGVCKAIDTTIYCDTGCTNNDNGFSGLLWGFHGDGPYQVKNHRYKAIYVRTARPAVTWLRAPGMLQACLGIEHIMDHGIRKFDLNPYQTRYINLARPGFVNLMGVEETTDRCTKTFETMQSKYEELKGDVAKFNSVSKWRKKGISIQAMRYPMDISFHTNSVFITVFKQDASVQITVGGIDIGQGTHTRCAQVAAHTFGIPLDMVSVRPASTDINANSAPTGGTVSSHVAMRLIQQAGQKLLKRLEPYKKALKEADTDTGLLLWKKMIAAAGASTCDLQERAQGNFTGKGSSYACYGSSVAVVELDCLTGENVIEEFNLLYDAGEMVNVGIELGQIEGGLIMGIGWLKMEDLTWDDHGAREHGTWEYKVPMHLDLPKKFSVSLSNEAPEFKNLKNHNFPMSSKGAGEASMALSLVYKNALQNAVEAFNSDAELVRLPTKPEYIFSALKLSKDQLIVD